MLEWQQGQMREPLPQRGCFKNADPPPGRFADSINRMQLAVKGVGAMLVTVWCQ